MNSKYRVAIGLMAALSLIGAACGSDDSTTTDTTEETTEETTAETTAETTEETTEETTDTTEAPSEGASFVTLDQACAEYDGLQAQDGFRVNLVTDIGKVDDGTFNQFAFEGLTAAVECFGIAESDFIEVEFDYPSDAQFYVKVLGKTGNELGEFDLAEGEIIELTGGGKFTLIVHSVGGSGAWSATYTD